MASFSRSSYSSVGRVTAECFGGHGSDSHRGLNFCLRPMLVPCWSFHLDHIFLYFHLLSQFKVSSANYHSMHSFSSFPLAKSPPCDLQIMLCSYIVPSKHVLLQIILCSCVIGTMFSREKWQIASLSCLEVIKTWKQT